MRLLRVHHEANLRHRDVRPEVVLDERGEKRRPQRLREAVRVVPRDHARFVRVYVPEAPRPARPRLHRERTAKDALAHLGVEHLDERRVDRVACDRGQELHVDVVGVHKADGRVPVVQQVDDVLHILIRRARRLRAGGVLTPRLKLREACKAPRHLREAHRVAHHPALEHRPPRERAPEALAGVEAAADARRVDDEAPRHGVLHRDAGVRPEGERRHVRPQPEVPPRVVLDHARVDGVEPRRDEVAALPLPHDLDDGAPVVHRAHEVCEAVRQRREGAQHRGAQLPRLAGHVGLLPRLVRAGRAHLPLGARDYPFALGEGGLDVRVRLAHLVEKVREGEHGPEVRALDRSRQRERREGRTPALLIRAVEAVRCEVAPRRVCGLHHPTGGGAGAPRGTEHGRTADLRRGGQGARRGLRGGGGRVHGATLSRSPANGGVRGAARGRVEARTVRAACGVPTRAPAHVSPPRHPHTSRRGAPSALPTAAVSTARTASSTPVASMLSALPAACMAKSDAAITSGVCRAGT